MVTGSLHGDQAPWSHSDSQYTPASTSEAAGEAGSATDLTAHHQGAKQSKGSSRGKGKGTGGRGRADGPAQWDPRRPEAQKSVRLSDWLQNESRV